MKKIIALLITLQLSIHANGQVITELFQQGQAQTKYLMQQIAALQVYIGYAQKGYSIAKEGLGDIGKIKKGDLDLHTGYINSLKSVNPKVHEYSKVAAIIKLQVDILRVYRDAKDAMGRSGLLTDEEKKYIAGVYSRLLDDCAATMDQLTAVTTDGKLQMTDDERLKRIDTIYAGMQSRYGFVRGFYDQSRLLAAERAQDKNDMQTSRTVNGVK